MTDERGTREVRWLGLEPTDLDGHTLDELTDYLDAGRQPARDLGLGAGQGVAQLVQAAPAGAGGDEQPVRAQRAGGLRDLADGILGPVKRHPILPLRAEVGNLYSGGSLVRC